MKTIDELKLASNLSINKELNKPGRATLRNPLVDEISGLIETDTTCIKAQVGGRNIWSGLITDTQEDSPDGYLNITAMGWLEILFGRVINPGQERTISDDAGRIIFALLDMANAKGPVLEGAPSSTCIKAGTLQLSAGRQKTFEPLQNIGEEILSFVNLENGVDIEVTPGSRLLNIHYPFLGKIREEVRFRLKAEEGEELGFFSANNLSRANRQTSKVKANRIWVTGAAGLRGFAQDAISQKERMLWEAVESLSNVSDANILGAYANAELLLRARPDVIQEFTPMAWSPADEGKVPRPLVDYDVGDILTFDVSHGSFKITSQKARLFGITVNYNEDGSETVSSMQLSYS
jgi:hypothetical protein